MAYVSGVLLEKLVSDYDQWCIGFYPMFVDRLSDAMILYEMKDQRFAGKIVISIL